MENQSISNMEDAPTTRSSKRKAAPSNDTNESKRSKELESLSQTVRENSSKIESLLALPDILKEQSEMLKKLMTRGQMNPEDNVLDEEANLGEADDESFTGDFVDDVVNSAQHDKAVTLDESIDEVVLEVLQSNDIEVEYSGAVSNKVAEAFKRSISQTLSKEGVDKLRNLHKPPENLKEISAPKVNAEIWNVMPRKAQTQDATQQFIQQFVSRGIVTQVKLAEYLSTNAASIPPEILRNILTFVMDGATQFGYAFKEMSLKRRQQIRPFLGSESATICSSTVPITEYLFGNNIEKELSTARASARLLKNATRGNAKYSLGNRRSYPYQIGSRNLNWRRPLTRGGRRPSFIPQRKFSHQNPNQQ